MRWADVHPPTRCHGRWRFACIGAAMAALSAGCEAPAVRSSGQPATASSSLLASGAEEFQRRWVPYPSIGGQWGRGPLSSADACAACHPGNGRGRLRGTGELPGAQLRLGQGDMARPDPRYGRQLDVEGLLGQVPAEGRLRIEWRERSVTLDDSERVTLRRPVPHIDDPAYGPLAPATVLSLRIAPALHGLGLLEAVDARQLDLRANATGIVNRVPDLRDNTGTTGRFGWKASQPSLRQQAAAAFIDDMGVTSEFHPADNCTAAQVACQRTETVPHPEVKPAQLEALAAYLGALGAPAPARNDAVGRSVFKRLGCDQCHQPALRTTRADVPLIHPYTDLRVHDLGEELADGLAEFDAGGAHWRTAPLWGLGKIVADEDGLRLLHDGRARDIQEAILWHGGEAEPMRRAYARLRREERVILLRFLQSL